MGRQVDETTCVLCHRPYHVDCFGPTFGTLGACPCITRVITLPPCSDVTCFVPREGNNCLFDAYRMAVPNTTLTLDLISTSRQSWMTVLDSRYVCISTNIHTIPTISRSFPELRNSGWLAYQYGPKDGECFKVMRATPTPSLSHNNTQVTDVLRAVALMAGPGRFKFCRPVDESGRRVRTNPAYFFDSANQANRNGKQYLLIGIAPHSGIKGRIRNRMVGQTYEYAPDLLPGGSQFSRRLSGSDYRFGKESTNSHAVAIRYPVGKPPVM